MGSGLIRRVRLCTSSSESESASESESDESASELVESESEDMPELGFEFKFRLGLRAGATGTSAIAVAKLELDGLPSPSSPCLSALEFECGRRTSKTPSPRFCVSQMTKRSKDNQHRHGRDVTRWKDARNERMERFSEPWGRFGFGKNMLK